MNTRKTFLLILAALAALLLSSCGTFVPEVGGEGQPCYGNGGCEGGLVCDASEICVQPGADGDVDFAGDEDDVVSDGDTADRDDADELADGDVTPDGDHPDGDDADGDEEPVCVCGPTVTDCCDGCHWTTSACTPEDEHAQGGHCDTGDCLIDACVDGWEVVMPDRLACEEIPADGDGSDGDQAELDVDEEIVTDGDEEIQPDGDGIDEPEADPDLDEIETTEIDIEEASDGDVDDDVETTGRHLKIGVFAPTETGVSSGKPFQAKITWHKTVLRRGAR